MTYQFEPSTTFYIPQKNELLNWKPIEPCKFECVGILSQEFILSHSTYSTDYYKVFVSSSDFLNLPIVLSKQALQEIRSFAGKEVSVFGKLDSKDGEIYVSNATIKKPTKRTKQNHLEMEGFCVIPNGIPSRNLLLKVPHTSGFHNMFSCRLSRDVCINKIKDCARIKISGKIEGFSKKNDIYVEKLS